MQRNYETRIIEIKSKCFEKKRFCCRVLSEDFFCAHKCNNIPNRDEHEKSHKNAIKSNQFRNKSRNYEFPYVMFQKINGLFDLSEHVLNKNGNHSNSSTQGMLITPQTQAIQSQAQSAPLPSNQLLLNKNGNATVHKKTPFNQQTQMQFINQVQNMMQSQEIVLQQQQQVQVRAQTPSINANLTSIFSYELALENYFSKYLTFHDLLLLSDTCIAFQQLMKHIFKTKFSEMELYIRTQSNVITRNLKTLRHFGEYLFKIDVNFGVHSILHFVDEKKALNVMIGEYLNKYCKKSLRFIKIHSAPLYIQSKWNAPFENVEYAEIYDSNLENLEFFFPKLVHLSINDKFKCNSSFKNLNHLEISIYRELSDVENYLNFFRQNPTLLKLSIIVDQLDANFMYESSRYLKDLKILEIYCMEVLNNHEQIFIHLNNIEKLTIEWCSERPLALIPFICIRIQMLHLKLGNNLFFHNSLIDFIHKNPSVSKLKIEMDGQIDHDKIKLELITQFSQLEIDVICSE